MQRTHLPIIVFPSAAVRRLAGADLDKVAGMALRAILKSRRSLEIAHQQISYRSQAFAFSSRIGAQGDLILELDVGDPRLADRIILEDDLAGARRFGQAAKPATPRPGKGGPSGRRGY